MTHFPAVFFAEYVVRTVARLVFLSEAFSRTNFSHVVFTTEKQFSGIKQLLLATGKEKLFSWVELFSSNQIRQKKSNKLCYGLSTSLTADRSVCWLHD